MGMTIYCTTGTGNSLWTAKKIAESFQDCRRIPMTDNPPAPDTGVVGFVFPVHIWGVPGRVIRTVKKLNLDPSNYYFAVAVHAGQVSRTLIQFRTILKNQGCRLSLGHELMLPSNYIPWGGPGSDEEIRKRIDRAEEKIHHTIIPGIRDRDSKPVEKGPLWQRIVFTPLYRLSFPNIPRMDGKFEADENCNGCEICEKVCIARNISLEKGRPVWHHRCEQCLACIQWCPEEAIQYGSKTAKYRRYHHPDIRLSDILPPKG